MLSNGIILGRDRAPTPAFGFDRPDQSRPGGLISYEGDAPVTVIAPTGAGKGVSCLIPMLLTYPGPVIAIDIKGELAAVTARRRLEMGQEVHVIDPFAITGFPTDRLNPFDLFSLSGSLLEPDAELIAALLGEGHGVGNDPFWSDTGGGLVAGLVAYIAACEPPEARNVSRLRDMLYGDDAEYNFAVLLDAKGEAMPSFAYRELSAFLQHATEKTRPSVLSTARTFLKSMNSPQVAGCMGDSSVSLEAVREGKPQTIYICIPPENLKSHGCMLKTWVGILLTALMRRKEDPEERTLFVLDEAAQLGEEFQPLLTASTLMRGYGLQLVTAWQDIAQIKSRYPKDWQTILNNSGSVTAFGFGHWSAARDMAEVLGIEPGELLKLKPDEAVLAVRGEPVRTVRRVNYLRDREFAGLADVNPYHARRNRSGKAI